MRSAHQRNASLLPDKHRNNLYVHHRSYSQTKHNGSRSRPPHYVPIQHFPTETFTLPLSTQLQQSPHTQRTNQKQYAKHQMHVHRQSKEKHQHKKSVSKGEIRHQKSKQKHGNFSKPLSKEYLKNESNRIKEGNSTEKKHSRSYQLKKSQTGNKKKNKKGSTPKEANMNWEEVIKNHGQYLTFDEIAEIKEYKWVYFLGKIPQRKYELKNSNEVPIHSARQYRRQTVEFQMNAVATERGANLPDKDQEDQFYQYQIGDHIAYRYEIIESINQGSFGQVFKVFDHKTKELVALKIAKRCQELVQQTFMQITILTQIREKDKANLSGVVRIKDFTIFRHHICMVFELLEGNLYELLAHNNYNGLSQDIVRIFAVQILNSLHFLQKERVIHCDIKPENIVMKTWGKSGIKLIDFGTSCFEGKQIYQYLQSRYYRAPQIIFKKRYSYPIDIWSLGCLLAQLKIGEPIFAGSSNLEQLLYIANSIGFPAPADGTYSTDFYVSKDIQELISKDYINSYKEALRQQVPLSEHNLFSTFKYVQTCMKTIEERLKNTNCEDTGFYNFILKLLVWEPSKRLKPEEALQDPWITKGLPNEIKQLYTVFHSTDLSKSSKLKVNKDSRSKPKQKSRSKDSKQRNRKERNSGQRKSYNGKPKIEQKGTIFDSKIYRYNGRMNSGELMKD